MVNIYVWQRRAAPESNRSQASPRGHENDAAYGVRESTGPPGGIRTPDLLIRSQLL